MEEKCVAEEGDRYVNQAVWWDRVPTNATSDIFSEQCWWNPRLQCFCRVQHLWNVGINLLANTGKRLRRPEPLITVSHPTWCLALDADPMDRPQHKRYLRGGAGKSLARPTSWCGRMESIVLLERWVCSCAELQVFFWYRGWKEACQVTCAISTKSRRKLSSSFFSYKARRRRKFTPFW